MKFRTFLWISITLILFSSTKEQELKLTDHESDRYTIKFGSWQDLVGVVLECPNKGVLKNFVLKKEDNQIYYKYQCYSSDTIDIDYGEPIIKQVTLTNKYENYITRYGHDINYLNSFSGECLVDYGLNHFEIINTNKGLNRKTLCHGLKTSWTSTLSISTEKKQAYYTSLDGLVDVVVGSTAQENDVDIGYPLRSFKYVVESAGYYPIVSYIYSYSKLRNMKPERQAKEKRMSDLRKSNTQED